MDFLKNHLARLQQQFAQLSASQKMLTMSLIAIMIMTLVWWGRYAGQAEMESVLEQDFAPEDIARITTDLRSRGIAYSLSGARILVPSDRKVEVLGSLAYQDMLPHDSPTPLMELMNKSSSAFDSQNKTDLIANEGRQQSLAMIIHTFPQVRHAQVMLAAPQHRTFDNTGAPSAVVNIQLKPGSRPDNHLATAAANVIVGAISGMNRANVQVVIDGTSRPVAASGGDDELGNATTYMEQVREGEEYYSHQISAIFGFCDGVMAHVNVDLKVASSESKETKIDPKSVIVKENDLESETQSIVGANHAGGEAGVAPNTGSNQGMSIGGQDGGAGPTMEKTHSKSVVIAPETQTTTRMPSGSCIPQSASVAFPRSYLVRAYEKEMQTDKEPSKVVFDTYVKQKLEEFKATVNGVIHLKSDAPIYMSMYTEMTSADAEPPMQVASGVTMMLGSHVREIALGALALMSLFMVPMIVRKGGSPAMLAGAGFGGADAGSIGTAAAGATVDSILAKAMAKGIDTTAEVAEGGQTLDGVELDEESLRNQQVLEQVSALVKDNPDAAATLVKRWMNRT